MDLSHLSNPPSGDRGEDLRNLRKAFGELEQVPDQLLLRRSGVGSFEFHMNRRMVEIQPDKGWLEVIVEMLERPPDWWAIDPSFWEWCVSAVLVEWLHLWPDQAISTFRELVRNPKTRLLAYRVVSDFGAMAEYPLTDSLVEIVGDGIGEGVTDEEAETLITVLAASENAGARKLFQIIKEQVGPDMPLAARELSLLPKEV